MAVEYVAYEVPDDDSPASIEMRRRLEQWAVHRYRPTKAPHNPQFDFHQSRARVRIIIGSNRSGKTQCPCAEVAAVTLGAPYPFWFNWDPIPEPPCSVWIVIPFFNENPASDARIKKLFLGEEGSDKEGNRIIRPPLIPPEMIAWHKPDYSSVRLINGSTIDFKASSQQSIQLASANVDLIFIDEPTRESHWNESLARMMALPGSRLIHCCTDTTIKSRYLDRALAKRDKIPVFTFTTDGNPYKNQKDTDEIADLFDDAEREVRVKGRRFGDTVLCYPDIFLWKGPDGLGISKNGKSSNWIAPFKCPPNWTRYVIHDPGRTNPSGSVWFAVEPNGDIHAYKCRYWVKPPWSTSRLMKDMMETNEGEKVSMWYMDPKAAKQPQVVSEDYYVKGKRLIDLYRESSEEFGVFWRLGSPRLEAMSRMDRVLYTHAYLDPLDNSHPMLWIHDRACMQPLREEFMRYRYALSNKSLEYKANPETTHEADNHLIYCVESACIMKIRNDPDSEFGGVAAGFTPQGPMGDFMRGNRPEGYFDDTPRA